MASSQEMVKTPDRFRVNMPFGNPDIGLKSVLFDAVPTDLTPQQEEIVGDASALIGQMVRHDMIAPERYHFLHGNNEVTQLKRDQYTDLGEDAEPTYNADVKALQSKAREGGLTVLSTARDAWAHGAEAAPAVMVMTAKTPDNTDIGYELKLMGNAVAGSEYNTEVLPNLVPGIASVTISEKGTITMRTSDGKTIDNVPENQRQYIRNLLVKLQGKVDRSTEKIARAT